MGTNNFYNQNASQIFAYYSVEEWEFDHFKDNLQFELQSKKWDIYEESDHNSNFSGLYIASKTKEFAPRKKSGYEYDFDFEVRAIIRSGYYDGCNLDFEVYFWGEEIDLEKFNCYGLEKQADYCNMTLTNMKKINSFIHNTIKELEKIYIKYTDQLQYVGAGLYLNKTKNETMNEVINNCIA